MKNFGAGLVKEIAKKDDKTDANDSQEDIFSRVVRCKGELWLSNADCCPITIHSAGRQLVMTPAGDGKPWMGKVIEVHPNGDRESNEPDDVDCVVWEALDVSTTSMSELKELNQWTDRFKDRRSELVLIGIKLDKVRLVEELENALLTDEEFNVEEKNRKKLWATDLKDAFFDGMPLWNLEDIMNGDDDDEDDDQGACAINGDEEE